MQKNEFLTKIDLLKAKVLNLENEKTENLSKIKNAEVMHQDCSVSNITIIKN